MDENIQAASSPAPSAEMLGALLSNPELLGRIGSIIASATQKVGETDNKAPQAAHAPNVEAHVGAPPSGAIPDGLGAALSDPALLEKLPQIISMIKPMLSLLSQTQAPISSAAPPAICRDQLLVALKPFLSPSRCEAVDSIIRISKLGVLFAQLK